MHRRHVSRLPHVFSKNSECSRAVVAFYYTYYSFARIHRANQCTPAIEARGAVFPLDSAEACGYD